MMDPTIYAGARGQGQQVQGTKVQQQVDLFSQRQDDSWNQKGKQPKDSFKTGRQEDPFGQRPKPDDHFARKGKQEDLFGNEKRTETTLRVQDEPQRRPYDSYGSPKRPLPTELQKEEGGGRDSFGEFSSSTQLGNSQSESNQYTSVLGETELHGLPGSEIIHNPAVQTMVKMVTMLNFMKVELGETKTLRSKEQWRAAGAEFIGTLLFVFMGCGSVVSTGMLFSDMTPSRLVAIAIAHGLAITCLAGATGAISGGHLNPAVTLAFVVAGKENLVRAGLYVSAQVLGAIFGAVLLRACTPDYLRGSLGSHDVNELIFTSQAFLMEMVLTFLLIFVIFGVAVDRRGPGVIAPIPIGFAVSVDHIVGVPYTGASMNPARSFGPAFVSGYYGSAHLLYWAAPCFGATAAAALYRHAFLEPAEAAAAASSENHSN